MRFSPVRLATALALITATGGLAACSTSNAATTSSSKPLSNFQPRAASHHAWSKYSFVIGDNGGDGSQALSQLTGVFNKAPYKVTFARFTYGPPLVQAASSGDIDLGSVGDVPPITGAASEYGFSVVGVAHYINTKIPDEDIIVPKGSPIHSLSQLKGKKIAVPQGSSANGLVLLALKSVGLKFNQVHIDYLSPAAGATAFQSGKVDAWAIWNPQVSLAVKAGARIIAKGLPPIDQASNYYVAPNRDLTGPKRAAFTDLFERLAAEFAWAVKHPAGFAQALSQEDTISLADAKAIVPASEWYIAPVKASDIQAEQALSDAFFEAGAIKRQVTFTHLAQDVLPPSYNSLKVPGL